MSNLELKRQKKRIFIFGYFGMYNFGDDAICFTIIKQLLNKYTNSTITITLENNYFINKNKLNNIKIIPFSLLLIIKEIYKSDIFIISGGTHFQDQDKSLFLKLKVFFFFFIIVSFGNLINHAPILLGHGIGPLKYTWTKLLVKIILKKSKIILVRDTDSFDLVKNLGIKEKCILGFDLTALFPFPQHQVIKKNAVLGFSLLPYYSIYENNSKKDEVYINNICNCLKKLLVLKNDLEITFISFRSGKKHSDDAILLKLINNLQEFRNRLNFILYSGEIFDFIMKINNFDYYIGMRYHSSLLAYLFQKPLVLIDYQQKCRSLAKDIVLSEGSIIELPDLETNSACLKIYDLVFHPENHYPNLPLDDAKYRAKKTFDYL